MAEDVKTFMLCGSHRKLISRMDDKQVAELFRALFAHNDDEEVTIDDPLVDTVFMVMAESMDRMRQFREQKKANGKNGGRPKKNDNQEKPNETKNNQDEPSESETNLKKHGNVNGNVNVLINPPVSPLTGGTDATKEPYSAEFQNFWQAYPKKTGKDAAWRAWKNKKREGRLPPVTELVGRLDEFKKTEQWTRDGGQYIPNPSTWLNQCRWLDELPGSTPSKGYSGLRNIWDD